MQTNNNSFIEVLKKYAASFALSNGKTTVPGARRIAKGARKAATEAIKNTPKPV